MKVELDIYKTCNGSRWEWMLAPDKNYNFIVNGKYTYATKQGAKRAAMLALKKINDNGIEI